MLVFVDLEHADNYTATTGEWMMAARTRITYRLEDLSSQHCMLVRHNRLTATLLADIDARAIFISGNSGDFSQYAPADLAELSAIIQTTDLPIFGFCGGLQMIALALGVPLVRLDLDASQADDRRVSAFSDGTLAEFGYHPVDLHQPHPLLDGLAESPVFRHAHALHVPVMPTEFEILASTELTPVQLAVHNQRRIVGTQFHPEYWTDEHPDGQLLITNFLRWARVIP